MQETYGSTGQARQKIRTLTLVMWGILIALSLTDIGAMLRALPYLPDGRAWEGVDWYAPCLAILTGLMGWLSMIRLQILDTRESLYLPLTLAPMTTLCLSGAGWSEYLALGLCPLLIHIALRSPVVQGKPLEPLYLGLIVGGLSLFSAQALWLFVPLMGGMLCMRWHSFRSPLAFALGVMCVLLIALPILVVQYPYEVEGIVRQWADGFTSPFLTAGYDWGKTAGQWALVAWGSIGLLATLWGWEGIRHLGTLQRNRAIAVQVITLLTIPLFVIYGGVASLFAPLLAYTLSVSVARALGAFPQRQGAYAVYLFALVWLFLSLLP